jgi:hypothetical protein
MTPSLLTGLWIVVLAGAALSFAAVAMLQSQRARQLARRAHEMGLAFSGEDLFDAPRRYAAFALMQAGHSCRAHNLVYGRREGMPMRAFDVHYEVGHGANRSTRRYWAIAVEADRPLRRLILWNRLDHQRAPLEARFAGVEFESWFLRGNADAAAAVAGVLRSLAAQGVSFESSGNMLLLCLPAHRRALAEASQFEIASACARLLGEAEGDVERRA